MLNRNLILGVASIAATVLAVGQASAQNAADRFGEWRMDSDNPAPASNIMTYEPWGDGGMAITVASVNTNGQESEWGYNTLFDGQFREVWGQDGSSTAVEWVNERTTRIHNQRDGRVTQTIINTLSEDGSTIENEYIRFDESGQIVGVSHATYRRIN